MNLKPMKNNEYKYSPLNYKEVVVCIKENTDKPKKELNPDDYLDLDGDQKIGRKPNGKYSWEDDEDTNERKVCLCRYCKNFKCE